MKKLLLMLLCLLLPLCALADGHGGIGIPKDYAEYLKMMQDSQYDTVSIRQGFVWPTEEVTLNWTGEKWIEIVGGMTIPENVTVNCSQMIAVSAGKGDMMINGVWNCLSDTGVIYSSLGNVIYNGPVTFTCDKRVRLSNSDTNFIFNGPMHINALVNAQDLTLGDGVVIDGEKSLQFDGTLSVPEGSVSIGVQLNPGGNDDQPATIAGQMAIKELFVSKNSPCLIAAGSCVTVESLAVQEEGTLRIDGTVELAESTRHMGMRGTIALGDAGELILQQKVRLGNNLGGKITGTGTLRLNARVREDGSIQGGIPSIFNVSTYEKLPEEFVEATVKTVRNWKE